MLLQHNYHSRAESSLAFSYVCLASLGLDSTSSVRPSVCLTEPFIFLGQTTAKKISMAVCLHLRGGLLLAILIGRRQCLLQQ